MASKTETFFLESKEDALKFVKKCSDERITAVLLPAETADGRDYYPVKVTYDISKLRGKK